MRGSETYRNPDNETFGKLLQWAGLALLAGSGAVEVIDAVTGPENIVPGGIAATAGAVLLAGSAVVRRVS